MKKPDFRFIWSVFMMLIFLGMFFLLVFTNYFSNMSSAIRYILGAVFLIYAVFRGSQILRGNR